VSGPETGWAFVVTDDQRRLVIQALTDKATQITQAARTTSGNAHQAALATAAQYTETANQFSRVGEPDTLIPMRRDQWLLVLGWVWAVAGEGDFPWFIAEFLAALAGMTGIRAYQ
jgi:hypothetical protein